MAAGLTSIRLDKKLADKAARILGARSRTEAVQMALEQIVKPAPKAPLSLPPTAMISS